MLILPPEWQALWQGKDPFDQIFALQGKEFRNMDGRRTLRFELLGKSYFVKMYSGLGWKRLFKSLLTLRRPPVASARNEWKAIQALHHLGVETMTIVAYGERGHSLVERQSFLVTEDLVQTESLEDFCRDWLISPPPPRLKRALITRVAEISRMLHENGLNHRDYYLCHFLLDVSSGRDRLNPEDLHLYLIDLHRVQIRNRLPYRWRLKDLAGLYFSSLEIGLTTRDYYRFIQVYIGLSLRESLRQYGDLWRRITQRGVQLQKRFDRKYRSG
ncbi:lipopolysaccharide core heptose(I) kinase RfaP [Geoalkalibacter subterraneus]|uniref:Heptose kinase n=1 Tax=Geoalkalibacter subterraneus TaxID=483547 RepID=A0A0B5FRV1_9BACT|nr:lipopolysaccharide core heptose(I) kinase RfaP [Geoalkalibacter subterraneus]AJF06880.1 heptose kinase [Geoalkalibacter subterraneus]